MWFGISKYHSSSNLLNAVCWSSASRHGAETFLGDGPIETYLPTNTVMSSLKGPRRNVMERWFGNHLHDLWCSENFCFSLKANCKCRLCGSFSDNPKHLSVCHWTDGLLDSDDRQPCILVNIINVLSCNRL